MTGNNKSNNNTKGKAKEEMQLECEQWADRFDPHKRERPRNMDKNKQLQTD